MMCQIESGEKHRRRPWTEEEDVLLLEVTRNFKRRNWSQIAKSFYGRTGEQCRQRFYSRPERKYKKGGWTQEEDDTIIRLQVEHGNCWSKISKHLPDRSENCIKNRWHSLLQHIQRRAEIIKTEPVPIPLFSADYDLQHRQDTPRQSPPSHIAPLSDPSTSEQLAPVGDTQAAMAMRGPDRRRAPFVPWTEEEDRSLLDAVRRLVPDAQRRWDWQSIASQVAGRSGRQCWQRFHQQLQADFRAGGWTAEEDAAIVEHQARLGNRWAVIATLLPQRSANAVKNRWNCHLRHHHPPPTPRHGVAGGGPGEIGPPAVAPAKDSDPEWPKGRVGQDGSVHPGAPRKTRCQDRGGPAESRSQWGTAGRHDSDSALAHAFAGTPAGRPPFRLLHAAVDRFGWAGRASRGSDAAGSNGSGAEDSDSGWSPPREPADFEGTRNRGRTTADGGQSGSGSGSGGGPGRACRRRGDALGGRDDGAADGGGACDEDDWGDSDSEDSECGTDRDDSDWSAGRPPRFESGSEGSATRGGGGAVGEERDVAQPWPAGGAGGEATGVSSWGGAGADADRDDWAAFPGPLPPVAPASRTAAAAAAAGGVPASGYDPMALEDAEWAVRLALPPPVPTAARATSPAAVLGEGAAPRQAGPGPH
jgi:hypothetical protein